MKKIKTENLTAKIFSIIIAILLWSYVMGVENPRETRVYKNVRISFENVQSIERKGLVLSDTAEKFVNIKVSGKKNDLEKLTTNSLVASVDLEGYSAGDSRIRVDAKYESNLGSIQIESVTPADILVKIDKIISRNMPVKILNENMPADNYIVGDITTSTPQVSLKGPQTLLDKVKTIETYIDTSSKTESFTLSNPVVALDEYGDPVAGIDINPSVIDITVPIFKTIVLPIEINQVGQLPALYTVESIKVEPATVALKVVNRNHLPSVIKTEEINFALLTGNQNKEINLIIPEGLSIVDNSKKYMLDVKLNKYSVKRINVTGEKLIFENVPEGLEIDKTGFEDSYTVDIRGLEERMLNLKEDDLKFVLDLTNAVEGSNTIGLILDDNEDKIIINQEVKVQVMLKKAEHTEPEEETTEKDEDNNSSKSDKNEDDKDKTN